MELNVLELEHEIGRYVSKYLYIESLRDISDNDQGGEGVFIEDTNHQLYNACQQVGSWILPIVLISKSKYILLFLKYVKIRDLDCKKNIHLEHQFQVFVIEQLYVCPSWFKKTNICWSTYIKGCYHALIPIMKIFIIWLKQLATDIAVQVFKISK